MDVNLILENLDAAINLLLENEIHNIKRSIKEEYISSKLSNYLTPMFPGYSIDTEYNGDIDNHKDRKVLEIATNRIKEINKIPNLDNKYKFTPDIIIHKQGSNINNLVVIEVKKDRHEIIGKEYDLIKLEHLTVNWDGNHYNYKIGVAIILGTGNNAGTFEINYFQDGIPKERNNLN